ncbi:hypothetical protein JAO71_13915 [Olleya sp. YSTF-M6]|uniref:DUF7738 domain-containing protein n=1 Tax=Olleya sediminilitoris TaxID=2795739 RepID=A0ABS1WP53_9FLAO|nr:hypothetical protein [Olleya sediminilitoris]MBL7560899.1 hypothetical protein [Olleya sediminilitoris]
MRVFYFIIISFFIQTSCKEQKDNIKIKNTPQVSQMLESYNKQKHRLAFNGCEMTYNEKPFSLGMSLKDLNNVFGEYETTDLGAIIFKDIGIVFAGNDKNVKPSSTINIIYLYMNTEVSKGYEESLRHKLNHINNYFLIEGMPLDKNMFVMDFIANSEFKLNDFAISNQGYEIEYNCNNKKMGYFLDADGTWLRKGSGHLTFKDKPNPENKNPFEMIYITEISE